MSAVQEFRAAIEKLAVIKSDAGLVTQGADPEMVFFRTDDDTDADGESFSFGFGIDVDDEELASGIVTLHRTIDAQLAILAGAIPGAQLNAACGTQTTGPTLALARAINGLV